MARRRSYRPLNVLLNDHALGKFGKESGGGVHFTYDQDWLAWENAIPGTTPTTHLIKPQIGPLPDGLDLSDSVENEYYGIKLMEAFGMPVNQVEMKQFAVSNLPYSKRTFFSYRSQGGAVERAGWGAC